MKIVGFEANNGVRLGVVDGDTVVDLQSVDANVDDGTLCEVVAAGTSDAAPFAAAPVQTPEPLSEVVDAATFAVPDPLVGVLRLLIAVQFAKARLIDNIGATAS